MYLPKINRNQDKYKLVFIRILIDQRVFGMIWLVCICQICFECKEIFHVILATYDIKTFVIMPTKLLFKESLLNLCAAVRTC